MGSDSRYYLCIHVQNSSCFSFLSGKIHYLLPELFCSFCRTSQEAFISVIGSVVLLDKVSYIYGCVAPASFAETIPFMRPSVYNHDSGLLLINKILLKYILAHCRKIVNLFISLSYQHFDVLRYILLLIVRQTFYQKAVNPEKSARSPPACYKNRLTCSLYLFN